MMGGSESKKQEDTGEETREATTTSATSTTEHVQRQIFKLFTVEERDHLILLGSISGCPGIIKEAAESENIFDPAHMERALAMKEEWARKDRMLREVLERQRRMFERD